MKSNSYISYKIVLARILLLGIPTIAIAYFILFNLSNYYALMQAQYVQQTIVFSLGLIASIICASFKLRLSTTTLVLFLIYLLIQSIINNISGNEFDGFFIAVQFKTFSILFLLAWLIGFLLIRIKWFSFLLAGILLITCIVIIAKTGNFNFNTFLLFLLPVLLFTFYIIYASLHLYKKEDAKQISFSKIIVRVISLILFLGLTYSISILFVKDELKAKLAEVGGGSSENKNSLLKTDKEGNTSMNDKMGVGTKNETSKELLFCAKIDNYFDGTDNPNPIYLTSGHYNKYDTLTETFEIDPNPPFDDNFNPNLSKIPLYFSQTDSSKLSNAFAKKYLKTVEVEIYKKKNVANIFAAPTTSFYVQPITVENSFRNEFASAYRAKSVTSQLNSAYFVYNVQEPMIQLFQQQRFEVLRNAKDYSGIDSTFLKYYTWFPPNQSYNNIRELANTLSYNKPTTIDKVLAIRDYFLQKNSLGEQIYKYSNNPGIPGLPGKNKLSEFLFETKTGYCAYYAGATLFLLRAMGIPSRISYGFSTIDRSSNNKGWYWYYANQAHAWVQVYFPEYGWLDFDTTVGNEDMEQAPQPDGTPPMQPPKPSFVESAIIESIDTVSKLLKVKALKVILNEREINNPSLPNSINARKAKIIIDSSQTSLSSLKPNDIITAISYDNDFFRYTNTSALPDPMPVDEVYFVAKKQSNENNPSNKKSYSVNWWALMILALILAILLFLFLPLIILRFYKSRKSKITKHKAYNTYQLNSYYLHQLGIERSNLTAIDYAESIDNKMNLNFVDFTNLYLKIKYSNKDLSENETKKVDYYSKTLYNNIRNKFTKWQRLKLLFRPLRAINYLIHLNKN